MGNLQLLEGELNLEKKDIEFSKWIEGTHSSEEGRNNYCQRNYIPECDYNICNFKEFIDKRNILIKGYLTKILDNGN